jgi:hypothetical protein
MPNNKPSIAALARKHGLLPHTVVMRLRRGWPLKRALAAPPSRGGILPDPNSIAALAREHGLLPHTVVMRLQRGHSLEQALAPSLPYGRRPDPHSIAAQARQHGLLAHTVQGRIHRGTPLQEALQRPLQHHRRRCSACDKNWADPPSRLCPGCEAYHEHQV